MPEQYNRFFVFTKQEHLIGNRLLTINGEVEFFLVIYYLENLKNLMLPFSLVLSACNPPWYLILASTS